MSNKIGVVVWSFPNPSNTFVYNELSMLLECGVDLHIYSINTPELADLVFFPEFSKKFSNRVTYLMKEKLLCQVALMDNNVAFGQNSTRQLLLNKSHMPNYDVREMESVKNSSKAFPELLKRIRRDNITKLYGAFASADADLCAYIHYNTGIPYYFACHAEDLFCSFYHASYKAKTVTKVFCISDYNKNYLINKYNFNPDKLIVKRVNFLKCDDCNIDPHNIDYPYVYSAARLDKRKGLDISIHGFKILHNKYPEMHYIITGSGPEQEHLQSLVTDLGLGDFVHLRGHVSNVEVLQLINRCEFGVLTSIIDDRGNREGIPTFFIECMSLGKPCIGTYQSGNSELIEGGVTGYLTTPRHFRDVGKKMLGLYSELTSGQKTKFSRSVKHKIKKMFDNKENIKIMVDEFLK